MTPGRVAEAFAAAGTMGLRNLIVHVDWNQASIDSNRVCRDGQDAGEYVQWNPLEFAYLHDWNAILVLPDRRLVAGEDTLVITGEQSAIHAEREADSRGGWPAEGLDETVVATTATEGVLR